MFWLSNKKINFPLCTLIWRPIFILSGCSPIRSLLTDIQEASFGWLDNIEHVIESRQSYLLLKREGTLTSTLILCHQDEETLEELKVLV